MAMALLEVKSLSHALTLFNLCFSRRYALDASLYRPLQASLISRGVPCWVVPIRAYMWAPTFGGRSDDFIYL
jgi:hypothetical protein